MCKLWIFNMGLGGGGVAADALKQLFAAPGYGIVILPSNCMANWLSMVGQLGTQLLQDS